MDSSATRLALHSLLASTFPDLTIYFTPPGNILLTYPCIVYNKEALEPSFANTSSYVVGVRYQVMFISKMPGYFDSEKMFDLHGQGLIVGSNNSFESDDLMHDVFSVSVNSIS